MVPSLPLLSCESSVSVKENPDGKKTLKRKRATHSNQTGRNKLYELQVLLPSKILLIILKYSYFEILLFSSHFAFKHCFDIW